MIYTCTYPSPLGNILLAADEVGLTGLWFERQKYFANTLPKETISQETPVLIQAKKWLDVYFSGKEPDFTPALHPAGFPVSPGCMADLTADPLWTDYDIWRDCKKDGTDAGCASYVCTGCRRSSRT